MLGITWLILLLRVLCRSVIEQIEGDLALELPFLTDTPDLLDRAGEVPGCWLSMWSLCLGVCLPSVSGSKTWLALLNWLEPTCCPLLLFEFLFEKGVWTR